MNKAILVGRLTRDPEVRYTQGDNPIAISRFTLAVDRAVKKEGQPDADFIQCVGFGKTAEFSGKYFTQGMRVAISGRIQTGSYTNKDGAKVYTTEVVVESQEFAQSKSEAKPSNVEAGRSQDSAGYGFTPMSDDDRLPFN